MEIFNKKKPKLEKEQENIEALQKHLESFLSFAKDNDISIPISLDGNIELKSINDDFGSLILKTQKIYLTKNKDKIEKHPPFEKHPYITENIIQKNKKTLLLGTFPPPSYLHNQYQSLSDGTKKLNGINIDSAPLLYYFYGNKGSLWDKINLELDIEMIKSYLDRNCIQISDIILFTQRESWIKGRASDDNFCNTIPNFPLLENLLNTENSIENLVFTSMGWKLKGRKPKQKMEAIKTISFHDNINSAVSIFLRSIHSLRLKIEFQKPGVNEKIEFIPVNYQKIEEFYDLFAFYIFINDRRFLLCLGNSPSGNAMKTIDTKTFKKWIHFKFGDKGIQILNENPPNSRDEKPKRKRKEPIQKALGYNEQRDIIDDFFYELYSNLIKRNYEWIFEVNSRKLE